MNNDNYVSYDIAKQLKTMGFSEECFCSYDSDKKLDAGSMEDFNLRYDYMLSAPTLTQAAEWLRQNGIFIDVIAKYSKEIDPIRQFLPHPQYYFNVRIFFKNGEWHELPMAFLEWHQAMMTGIQSALNYMNGISGGA